MIIEKKVYDLNGHELVLRSAVREDAETLVPYLKRVCGETRFLRFEEDECTEVTKEQEEAFITGHMDNPRACLIIAELDGVYVGNASFAPVGPSRRNRHRADMGIALYQAYTGMGIGKRMFALALEAIRKSDFEGAELIVVADNVRAIAMYEKFGFRETGRIIKANRYDDGTYSDDIIMSMELKTDK